MKLKYRFLLIIAAIISIGNLNFLFSQDTRIFLNPGVKLGYTFGEDKGFTPGIEMSSVVHSTRHIAGRYAGILLSYDMSGNFKKTHFGIEYGVGPIGISFGPSWVSENEYNYLGWSVTPYLGFILIPYYSFTFIPGNQNHHEIGSFIKFPILIKGPSL